MRGVNLGGWLVLERWMTPSLFEGTDAPDEYTFSQLPDAAEKIRHHHESFITEEDFRWLALHDITAVRIPLGHWLFGGEDPYVDSVDRLDWAMETAHKYGIKVLLCLHGAPGSQNGRDHSGYKGKAQWFSHRVYRTQTLAFLERLAERYHDAPALWGIELLNEPKMGLFHLKLRRFHTEAYRRLTAILRPGTHIVFHDAFTPRLLSGSLGARKGYPVVMDVHWYQFASLRERWEPLANYFRRVSRRVGLIQQLEAQQPIIVGEWSVVLSGKILKRSGGLTEDEAFYRHAQLQLGVYAQTHGWFYWTYKTESPGIWHFRSQVEEGVINL